MNIVRAKCNEVDPPTHKASEGQRNFLDPRSLGEVGSTYVGRSKNIYI